MAWGMGFFERGGEGRKAFILFFLTKFGVQGYVESSSGNKFPQRS